LKVVHALGQNPAAALTCAIRSILNVTLKGHLTAGSRFYRLLVSNGNAREDPETP